MMHERKSSGFGRLAILLSFFLFAGAAIRPAPVRAGDATKLMEFTPSIGSRLIQGDRLFYAVDDGVHGLAPWVSDGTPDGTRMLTDPQKTPIANPYLFIYDSRGNVCLWSTDTITSGGASLAVLYLWEPGDTVGVMRKRHTIACAISSKPLILDSKLFIFSAWNNINHLMAIDADTGVAIVLETWSISIQDGSHNTIFTTCDLIGKSQTHVYYSSTTTWDYPEWGSSTSIGCSDGTTTGTRGVAFFTHAYGEEGFFEGPAGSAGSDFYFAGTSYDGKDHLWRADGIRIWELLTTSSGINPDPAATARLGPWTYLSSVWGSAKPVLWRTDGTTIGTSLVTYDPQITAGTKFRHLVFQNKLHALALGNNYAYLGLHDTNTAQLINYARIGRGSYYYSQATDTTVYFSAGKDRMLIALADGVWSSDGTTAGTYDLIQQNVSNSCFLALPGGKQWLVGTADGQLWQTDGTPSGTQSIGNYGGWRSNPYFNRPFFNLCKGKFVFCKGQGVTLNVELWSLPYPFFNRAGRAWMGYR